MTEFYGSADETRRRITSDVLLQALDYWESLSPPGALPSRDAIDPMAIPKLLPTTFIAIAEEDGEFRYQLAGSLIEEKYQLGSVKDKTPQDLAGGAATKVITPYRRVRDNAELFYREANLEWVSKSQKYTHYKVLLMPLSNDGKRVNMIFGVQDFVRAELD